MQNKNARFQQIVFRWCSNETWRLHWQRQILVAIAVAKCAPAFDHSNTPLLFSLRHPLFQVDFPKTTSSQFNKFEGGSQWRLIQGFTVPLLRSIPNKLTSFLHWGNFQSDTKSSFRHRVAIFFMQQFFCNNFYSGILNHPLYWCILKSFYCTAGPQYNNINRNSR